MTITIPDSLLEAARMTESELQQEIALLLYEKEKITQASRLAGLSRLRFQHLLASRGSTIHYDVEDFEQDLETLRSLDRL
jgi:predicted HTH domain antitoxin